MSGNIDYNEILQKIANYTAKNDSTILLCALELAYKAGVMKKEIPLLKIGDMFDMQGNVLKKMPVYNIDIPTAMHTQLKTYLQYLKAYFSANPGDSLFPGYNSSGPKTFAAKKKLERDLKIILAADSKSLFKKLSVQGQKVFYIQQKSSGINESICIDNTAKQFRVKKRSVSDSINGTIQPAGNKLTGSAEISRNFVLEMCKLDSVDYSDKESKRGVIQEFKDFIDKYKDKEFEKTGMTKRECKIIFAKNFKKHK